MNFVYLEQKEDLDLEILMKMANHLNLQNSSLLLFSGTRPPLLIRKPYSFFVYDYNRAIITDARIYRFEDIYLIYRGLENPEAIVEAFKKHGMESLTDFRKTMFAILWDDLRKELVFMGYFFEYYDEFGENLVYSTNPVSVYKVFRFIRKNLKEMDGVVMDKSRTLKLKSPDIQKKDVFRVDRCISSHPFVYDNLTPHEYFSIPHISEISPLSPLKTYIAEFILGEPLVPSIFEGVKYHIKIPLFTCLKSAGLPPYSALIKDLWYKFAQEQMYRFIVSMPF